MDFVSDSLGNGRRLNCLTVADDFSREAVDIAVDYGISERPRVHEPSLHRLGTEPRHSTHPDRARTPHAERLHRELQWTVPRRASERALVPDAAPSAQRDRGGSTTTRFGPTAALGECHQLGSQSSTAGMPAVLLKELTPNNEIQ